jgi:REP-associated tyrosine transposase
MPRRARLRVAGIPLHIVQRGNNRGACFFGEGDYWAYLQCLRELSSRYACDIHAYVLMTNHVHLLLTPRRADGASVLMKHLGQHYVQYVNRVHHRSGTLWEGRFRSSLVEAETYFLRCQRYIELNPVRAGIARSPEAYRWSSFAANGRGRSDTLVTPHAAFLALGMDDHARRSAYLDLFRVGYGPGELDDIRSSTNAGYALGSERFRRGIEQELGRRAGPGRSGRPVKAGEQTDRQKELL